MNHFIKVLLFIVVYLQIIYNTAEASEKKRLKKLIIFQTSDIHSHIEGEKTGWLNMAEMIKQRRSHSGGESSSLLIDCGDTIPGSLLGEISHGRAAVSILNTMHYDAWIPGNHDLEFGLETLTQLSLECSADIIAANMQSDLKNNFISWKLYKKNGINIALIGLTSPHIKEWMWGSKVEHYKIIPTEEAIDSTMRKILKMRPDLIILAIHHGRFSPNRLQGFNIRNIADKYPQIDLILGAHSHQEVPGEKCGISTWYVESGAHAEKFAEIKITVDLNKKEPVRIESRLISVVKQKKISPEFTEPLREWRKKSANFAKKVIGTTKKKITSEMSNLNFSPISKLFCSAIKESTKADFVFHGTVVQSAYLEGEIQEKELFKVIPYEDTICLLRVSPGELKEIIKEQMQKRKMQHYQSYMGLNINFDYQDNIILSFSDGSPLKPGKRYLTAFSSYALAGAGGRFPILKKIAMQKNTQGVDLNIKIRDSLRRYIIKHSPLN
jgi:2',3'-cyclic-nucleotide 2'-phosphodiesterase (5'-nucleotidase family)